MVQDLPLPNFENLFYDKGFRVSTLLNYNDKVFGCQTGLNTLSVPRKDCGGGINGFASSRKLHHEILILRLVKIA